MTDQEQHDSLKKTDIDTAALETQSNAEIDQSAQSQTPADPPIEGQTDAEAITDATAASGDSGPPNEPPGPKQPTPKPARPKRTGRSGGGLVILLFLVLAGVMAALAYYGWQQEQALQAKLTHVDQLLTEQETQLNTIQRQTQTSVQATEAKVEASRRQVSGIESELQSRLDQQGQQLQRQLQTLQQQLRSITATTTEDWKLAEAYYLTRLAGQRLLMERDTGSALALLEAADNIVKNYPDPDLLPARRALADDMAVLRLANNVDLQGLYLRIAALGQQIQALPISDRLTFNSGRAEAEQTEEQSTETTGDQGIWATIRESFHRVLDRLQDYIRVSRDDDVIEPLVVGAAESDYLLSSLQLSLDTAQLALLREQPEIYQHTLERAHNIVTRLYADSDQRRRVASELNQLRDTNILQELPSISGSQQALSAYLDRRHRLGPQSSTEPAARGDQP